LLLKRVEDTSVMLMVFMWCFRSRGGKGFEVLWVVRLRTGVIPSIGGVLFV
jgi:hypothetical protein